jgi:hypothetical protein
MSVRLDPGPRPATVDARGSSALRRELREAAVESRWEAAPTVLLVIVLQLVLALASQQRGWKLWELPWWTWLLPVAPELALLLPLAFRWPRGRLEQLGHRRTAAVGLLAVVSAANALALAALIGSLLSGQETNGPELLFKGVTIWGTNVIAFGLWFWDSTAAGRSDDRPPIGRRRTSSSRSWGTRGWPNRVGIRVLSTTYTCRSPTRSRSAPPTRCPSPGGRSY